MGLNKYNVLLIHSVILLSKPIHLGPIKATLKEKAEEEEEREV